MQIISEHIICGVCVCSSLNHVQLYRHYGLQPASFLCPWDSPGKNAGVGLPFLTDSGIEPESPALQADSFPFEPPGNLVPSCN